MMPFWGIVGSLVSKARFHAPAGRCGRGGLIAALGLVLSSLVAAPLAVHATVEITDFSPAAGPFLDLPVPGTESLGDESFAGRMSALGVSADGRRVYAAAFGSVLGTGLWRSSDGGQTWCQLSDALATPCADGPASAIPVPTITEIAVSPVPADGSVLLAAAAFDTRTVPLSGIYRSTDSGGTWHRVHTFVCGGQVRDAHQVRFAPDDPRVVFASGGCSIARSEDGGQTWTETSPGRHVPNPSGAGHLGDVPIYVLGVSERALHQTGGQGQSPGHRWLYACSGNGLFVSADEGRTWRLDRTTPGGSCGSATGPHFLATEPGRPSRVYRATFGGSNGPVFFNYSINPNSPFTGQCNTLGIVCYEGSLLYGNFDNPNHPRWAQLSSPPVYAEERTTTSGNPVVITKRTPNGGFLIFFSDGARIHVHDGQVTAGYNPFAGWHRLEGWDPWAFQVYSRKGQFLHADPFDLAVTPDFSIDLIPATVLPGCNTLPVICGDSLAVASQGRIWVANDGGVFYSSNLAGTNGASDQWSRVTAGLSTLRFEGATVLARPDAPGPALYTATQDNSDWTYNPDVSPYWRITEVVGDGAPFYADNVFTDRIAHFGHCRVTPGRFGVYFSTDGTYPEDPGTCSTPNDFPFPPGAPGVAWALGNRPVVQTIPPDPTAPRTPPITTIELIMPGVPSTGTLALYRTLVGASGPSNPTTGDWQQIQPDLPFSNGSNMVVQAGNRGLTSYYVKDPQGNLYRGQATGPGSSAVDGWTRIVPGAGGLGACWVRTFFINPYSPNVVYIDDNIASGRNCLSSAQAGIKVSADYGATWQRATTLQAQLTNNGEFSLQGSILGNPPAPCPPGACLLNDMLFLWEEPQTAFAAGITGIFATLDSGATWQRLLDNARLPCNPQAVGFDNVTLTSNQTLYVFCEGRGALKIDGVPGP